MIGILLAGLSCMGSVVSYQHFLSRLGYDDFARRNGDEMAYHSLAVNMLNGHGFKEGIVDPTIQYKFLHVSETGVPLPSTDYPVSQTFFRTPGYPHFLTTIYGLFGVHPLVAKKIQTAFFCAAVFSIPLMGWILYGAIGLLAGGMSLPFVLKMYHLYNLNELYTETTQLISLLSIALAWFIHKSGRWQTLSMTLLGLACFYSLIVKGASLFIPPLFLFLLISGISSGTTCKKNVLIFLLSMLIPLACWSTYASLCCHKFVLLSTQSETVLLGGNNELSLSSGTWEDNHQYYRDDRFKSLSLLGKLSTFYRENMEHIPYMIKKKLLILLYDIPFPGFLLCQFVLIIVLQFHKWMKDKRNMEPWVLILYSTACGAALCYAGAAEKLHTWLLATALYVTFLSFRFHNKWEWKKLFNTAGVSLSTVLFLNIILINVILFGYRRYDAPYHYFIILFSFLLPSALIFYWAQLCFSLAKSAMGRRKIEPCAIR